MPTADEGVDTVPLQEPDELDIEADGSHPFRVVRWLEDELEPVTGEYDPIQREWEAAIAFWQGRER